MNARSLSPVLCGPSEMSRLIGACCVSLLLLSGGELLALELRLQATKASFRAGEPVVVRVLVTNPLDSTKVWYLKRGLWLVPFMYPMDGDLGLVTDVRGPDGTRLEPTTEVLMFVRMRTDPSMFHPLHRGEIFGQEIALDGRGLEYKMKAPGTYRVSAILSPAAPRSWFASWRRSNPDAPNPGFSAEDLYEGPAFAPPIEVVISE